MTIFGQHTVHELQELIAAKDVEMNDLVNAGTSYKPTWDASDSASSTQWQTDLTALQARYNTARTNAESVIALSENSAISPDYLPAESSWQAILTSVQQVPGTVTAGDLQDLYNRLVAVTGYAYKSNVPQPTALDADLNAYNEVEKYDPLAPLLGDKADPKWWKDFKHNAKNAAGVAAVGVSIYVLIELSVTLGFSNTLLNLLPGSKKS